MIRVWFQSDVAPAIEKIIKPTAYKLTEMVVPTKHFLDKYNHNFELKNNVLGNVESPVMVYLKGRINQHPSHAVCLLSKNKALENKNEMISVSFQDQQKTLHYLDKLSQSLPSPAHDNQIIENANIKRRFFTSEIVRLLSNNDNECKQASSELDFLIPSVNACKAPNLI